jgi:2-polyprenyl-3-methyl-5-hydroxy-6-metoxy-1,4-benzoquinol methylase
MWSSADARFDAFAAREPHFAVLTAPRFRQASLTPEHEREFFASGETIASWMLEVIDAALVPEFAPMTVLEYGCGIGRLAFPLARRPGSVTAVDRSPAMLARARQEAARRELQHILFQTDAELFAEPRMFDLVVCYHVLQRRPRHEALALVERLSALIAPGGVGVFQWPYRSLDSAARRASRALREYIPGVNALTNALRGQSGEPFIPTHVFDLQEMLPAFDGPEFRAVQLALEHHQTLDYAVALAERRQAGKARSGKRDPDIRTELSSGGDPVTDAEIDAFNQAAELYFRGLKDWDHHLAKPFSQAEETPVLLMNVAVMLQALRLTPGMRVLEFGAGSGWLARFLTQMGCQVILLDVSETALRMARELYTRQPVIGAHPPADFLLFDGRRIALSDASVDRILCFDSFHHAANPQAMVREFARLLVNGGVAAFAEPGPRHAGAPRSQFEADTYGVVERDVDVHQIWRTARASGFSDLRLSVFHGPPYQVSLDDYEQLLAGGPVQEQWLASTRTFLRHVRFFSLVKGGSERADSRTPQGLHCDIRVEAAKLVAKSGEPIRFTTVVTNSGSAIWRPSADVRGGVSLGTHLYDASGALVNFDFHTQPLATPPREIAPGETVRCAVSLPPLTKGHYRLELDCVASHVTWFAQAGARPQVLEIAVEE